MKSSNPRTLQYVLDTRAAHQRRDIGWVTYGNARQTIKHWLWPASSSREHPETEAIKFYAAQQVLGTAMLDLDTKRPLTTKQLDAAFYIHDVINDVSARALKYLFLICTREMRHLKERKTHLSANGTLGAYPEALRTFWKHNCCVDADTVHQNLEAASVMQDVPLRDFFSIMQEAFESGSWGSQYGGKKWAEIAQVLYLYIVGQTTAVQMCDTVWTLAHNGGPIFNKGYQYHCYDSGALLKILDVQRSGQIVEMVLNGEHPHVKPPMKMSVQKMMHLVPDWKPAKYVDWYAVEALGSNGSYPQEKAKQTAMYGTSSVNTAQINKAKKAQSQNIKSLNSSVYHVDHVNVVQKETRK